MFIFSDFHHLLWPCCHCWGSCCWGPTVWPPGCGVLAAAVAGSAPSCSELPGWPSSPHPDPRTAQWSWGWTGCLGGSKQRDLRDRPLPEIENNPFSLQFLSFSCFPAHPDAEVTLWCQVYIALVQYPHCLVLFKHKNCVFRCQKNVTYYCINFGLANNFGHLAFHQFSKGEKGVCVCVCVTTSQFSIRNLIQ